MSKKSKTIFGIFTEAVGLYFSSFTKFVKYMSFPVLGQVAGLALVFGITYLYTQNLPKLLDKFPNLNNLNSLIILSIIVTLPGLAIFTKAFWEYLVAYGAVNSMYENLHKSGRLYDFKAHTQLITRRTPAFIGLWFLLWAFTLLAIFPLLWIIGGILAVYFVLVFQVFTFEEGISPIGCFKKSFSIIKGHFGSTFLLIALIGILTYCIIPQLVSQLLSVLGISRYFSGLLLPIANMLPDLHLEQFGLKPLTSYDYALMIFEGVIAQILIQYTLPMRSILWTMWYKELDNTSAKPPKTRSLKKRPSEKLMEESHKKLTKKKIDKNLLKRAMEKDEDD